MARFSEVLEELQSAERVRDGAAPSRRGVRVTYAVCVVCGHVDETVPWPLAAVENEPTHFICSRCARAEA